jgi:hypothetical protein
MLRGTPFHISGAVLILCGTLFYACLRLYKYKFIKAKQIEVDEEDLVGSVNNPQKARWIVFTDRVKDWRSWMI